MKNTISLVLIWLMMLYFVPASFPQATASFTGTLAGSGSVPANTTYCVANAGGNAANNGLFNTQTKDSIMGCYDALPSAGGVILIMGSTSNIPACPSGSPAGCGIWIMGSGDPNYASPPAGWRRAKSVSFVGVGGWKYNTFGFTPQVGVTGGSNADNNHPGIWISTSGNVLHFENLNLVSNPGRAIVIGENSNNVRTGVATSVNVDMVNVGAASSGAGLGPTADLTGTSYRLKFEHCYFNSNQQAVSATDDTGAAVLLDGKNGGGASADFEETYIIGARSPATGGGSIKFYPPSGQPGYLYVHGLQTESLNGVPAVWITGTFSPYQTITVSDVSIADSTGVTPAVQNDGTVPSSSLIVNGLFYGGTAEQKVVGPATILGQENVTTITPQKQGQVGFVNGQVVGQEDASRRNFPPVVARFTNYANQLTSAWTGTSVTPVTAPDATNNAGELVGAAGPAQCLFVTKNFTPQIGDSIIAGVWVRNAGGLGYNSGNLPSWIAYSGQSSSDYTGSSDLSTPWQGDGEWEWVHTRIKFIVNKSLTSISFAGNADYTSGPRTTDFFGPVFIYVPAGTLSDNESAALEANLSTYRDDAAVGQVSLLRGEQFKADSIQYDPQTWGGSTPTCSTSVNYGAKEFILDGSTATWGATVAGSGTNKVWVGCNGTNWTVD